MFARLVPRRSARGAEAVQRDEKDFEPGKVFIDGAERRLQTTVAVYSLRAKKGATVCSVPVRWRRLHGAEAGWEPRRRSRAPEKWHLGGQKFHAPVGNR